MMNEIVQYLIRFLIQTEVAEEVYESVGYTSEESLFDSYKVVILPSSFFTDKIYATQASLPLLPLASMEGVPLLFGKPVIEKRKETYIVHADWIASAFFLLSRYEEMVRPAVRDEHGRFPGKESLAYRAGFIKKPVIESYGRMLRRILRETGINVPEPEKRIRQIYLTHDVDAPFRYRTWRNIVRAMIKEKRLRKPLSIKWGKLEQDPLFTFPKAFDFYHSLLQAKGSDSCQCVLFFRAGGRLAQDKPHYLLSDQDIRQLMEMSKEAGATFGLHASYEAGENPALIRSEKELLTNATGDNIRWNRNHFLRSKEPQDLESLIDAGITDDFTMGYADIAGFRLGTCRAIRWINPVTRHLTPLLLHPLTIMDCTLEEPKYMGLAYLEAKQYCIDLINETESAGGELSLLWHNTSLVEGEESYLNELYSFLITELKRR